MATDIAFALAVLASLGDRVPKSLRVFLATLAVADDIGGIIVIALFYSSEVALLPLGIGLALVGVVLLLGRMRIHTLEPYIILAIAVWALFLQSGIHPTIAGVLPIVRSSSPMSSWSESPRSAPPQVRPSAPCRP